MKVIKDFICMSFVLMLIITGCYEDKGSYNYSEWTGIDSVTGVEIPGSSYGRISLSEGELLEIDPLRRGRILMILSMHGLWGVTLSEPV